jgi:predicted amidohydrolase YtcJ
VSTYLICGAEVDRSSADVMWVDGRVRSVTAAGATTPPRDATVVEAHGGALIPGLHDHHVHLLALDAARRSVDVSPAATPTVASFRDALSARLGSAASQGWIRAVGYHETVAGALDADALDRLDTRLTSVPIRIQHRTGQLWILNGEALRRLGIAELDKAGIERRSNGLPTGRLFGFDAELRGLLPTEPTPDLTAVGRELASYGVTGVTDCTPFDEVTDLTSLGQAARAAGFPVSVTITGGPDLPDEAMPELDRGPVKILPDDHQPPDLQQLIDVFGKARATGRPIAVHCVTRVGLVLALAALDEVGRQPGDRIEHGAVIPTELVDELRDRSLIVITQPNFVTERGDEYLTDVEPHDRPHLWRCGSLTRSGVAVAGGTDAPFGDPDPWAAIAAATSRRTRRGTEVGPDERLPAGEALDLFLGSARDPARPRRVEPGAVTDLCLLDVPLAEALSDPDSSAVRLTLGRAGLAAPSR